MSFGTSLHRFGQSALRASTRVSCRRKWLVITISLLLAAAAAYVSTNLTITTSTRDILSPELQFVQDEERYRELFPSEDRIIVVVEAASTTASFQAATSLAIRLRQYPKLFETVEVPGASPFMRSHRLLFLQPERLREVTNQLQRAQPVLSIFANDPTLRGVAEFLRLSQTGIEAGETTPSLMRTLADVAGVIEARAAGEPATMAWNSLFDLTGGPATARTAPARAFVFATPVTDSTDLDPIAAPLNRLQSEIAELQARFPNTRMRVTGEPVLRQNALDEAFSGALYASGLSFVLVTLSLFLVRSWRLVLALVITLVIGSIITTGLASISVGRLNLISVAFLVLFFGLGVDFGTHFGLRHLEEARRGADFEKAAICAALGEGPGINLSALCASIGFLSFVPTDYIGLGEFGIIATLGMIVAVIATFTLLPALMAVAPPRPSRESSISIPFGTFVQRWHVAIVIAAVLGTIAAALLARNVRVDVNPLNLQNPDTEAVQAYRDLASNPQTSPYAVNIVAPDLSAAREISQRLAAVEGVAGTRTVETLIPDDQPTKLRIIEAASDRLSPVLNAPNAPPRLEDGELRQAFAGLRARAQELASVARENAGEAATRLVPALDRFAEHRGTDPQALRALDAALTGAMRDFIEQLRQMLSVTAVTLRDLPAGLRREWIAPDGRARVKVLPKPGITETEDFRAFAANIQAIAPRATGVPISVTEAGETIVTAFTKAIIYTTIGIAIVILILRRSITDLLLILAPLAAASLWTVAASVLFDMPFNFANVIVIPLLIGLGVASSIHIVVRARKTKGQNVLDTSTSLAVFVAQINTAAAFATLVIAEHRGLYSMGLLLGLAILFVLVASLIMLPAGMILMRRLRK